MSKAAVVLVSLAALAASGCDFKSGSRKSRRTRAGQVSLSMARTGMPAESFIPPGISPSAVSWDGRLFFHGYASPEGSGVSVFRPERVRLENGAPVFPADSVSAPALVNEAILQPGMSVDQARARALTWGYDNYPLGSVIPDPRYPTNPYRSNADGSPNDDGEFETYRMIYFMTRGHVIDPATNQPLFQPTATVAARGTVVVRNPRTATASIERAQTDPVDGSGLLAVPLRTVSGATIPAFEVSFSADGRLGVFNYSGPIRHPSENFGIAARLYYSWNPSPFRPDGWSEPKPITEMYYEKDILVDGIRFGERFPIAEQPLRRADGRPFARGENYPAAYHWLSLDASEIFHPAALGSARASIRAGSAVIGRWTGYAVRHIDGPLNPDRNANHPEMPLGRGVIASPGAFTSMWSPFSSVPGSVLPYTRPVPAYPVFGGVGTPREGYSEVSFAVHEDGDYVVFFPMNELLTSDLYARQPGQIVRSGFDPRRTADISGKFNTGALEGACAFPVEYAQARGVQPADLWREDDNPGAVGRAVYFAEDGKISVPISAYPDSSIGQNALRSQLTAEIFVKRLAATGRDSYLVHRMNAYGLKIAADGKPVAWVRTSGREVQVVGAGTVGMNEWTHLAFTYDSGSGSLKLYRDGALSAEASTGGGLIDASAQPLWIGPGGGGTGSSGGTPVLLLDEFGLSRVVRSAAEIQTAAFVREDRAPTPTSMTLPRGLRADQLRMSQDPTGAQIDLGRQLFADARLSADRTVSCATCHDPARGFSDGRAVAVGIGGRAGTRNTPTVINRAFSTLQFWDGRAASLEEQALGPIENPLEMGHSVSAVVAFLQSDAEYNRKFQSAFGAGPSRESLGRALAAFQNSLVAGNSRVDEYEAGNGNALNDAERRGRGLFHGKARCVACHNGSNYTDELFHRTALFGSADAGRGAVTLRSRDLGAFKTPTLRDVALTAPYFHSGVAPTLETVVDLYNAGGGPGKDDEIRPLGLLPEERSDLVAFLRALNSRGLDVTLPTFPRGSTTTTTTMPGGRSLVATGCTIGAAQGSCLVTLQAIGFPSGAGNQFRARHAATGAIFGPFCVGQTTCTAPVDRSFAAGVYEVGFYTSASQPVLSPSAIATFTLTVVPAGGSTTTTTTTTMPSGQSLTASGCTIAASQSTCSVSAQAVGFASGAGNRFRARHDASGAVYGPLCVGQTGCSAVVDRTYPAGAYTVGFYTSESQPVGSPSAVASLEVVIQSAATTSTSTSTSTTTTTTMPVQQSLTASGCTIGPTQGTCNLSAQSNGFASGAGNRFRARHEATGTIYGPYCPGQTSCTATVDRSYLPGTYTIGFYTSDSQPVLSPSATATLVINIEPPAPPSASLAVIPCVIPAGASTCPVTIQWSVMGAAPRPAVRARRTTEGNESSIIVCTAPGTCTVNAPAGDYLVGVLADQDNFDSVLTYTQVSVR